MENSSGALGESPGGSLGTDGAALGTWDAAEGVEVVTVCDATELALDVGVAVLSGTLGPAEGKTVGAGMLPVPVGAAVLACGDGPELGVRLAAGADEDASGGAPAGSFPEEQAELKRDSANAAIGRVRSRKKLGAIPAICMRG